MINQDNYYITNNDNKITCECSKIINKNSKSSHKKTKYHKQYKEDFEIIKPFLLEQVTNYEESEDIQFKLGISAEYISAYRCIKNNKFPSYEWYSNLLNQQIDEGINSDIALKIYAEFSESNYEILKEIYEKRLDESETTKLCFKLFKNGDVESTHQLSIFFKCYSPFIHKNVKKNCIGFASLPIDFIYSLVY